MHLGTKIQFGDCTRFALPGPARLAESSEECLRTLGLGFRARNLPRMAQLVDGRMNLEALRTQTLEEGREILMSLPGVGPKVADCVLLFGLDHLDAFPIDRWVRRAVTGRYHGGSKISDRVLQEWARKYFGPYAGYAQQYLFFAQRTFG